MQIYIVKSGDSLYSIAKMFKTSLHILMEINGLERPNDLIVGQAILILEPEVIHTIQPNETLEDISQKYNTSINKLYRNNPFLSARPFLIPGDDLVISYTNKPTSSILVNGFVYPNINHELLTTTLPYLTYISPFTYSFSEDGDIKPLRDDFIVRRSIEYNVLPLMTLSPIDDTGKFVGELTEKLLNNNNSQEKLISQILNTIQNKKYSGVILNFEKISTQSKNLYINLIQTMQKILNENGYTLYIAIEPNNIVDANQYYTALGEFSNGIIIMTYGIEITQTSSIAISSIQKIEDIIRYITSLIPANKVMLGIPNHGYGWRSMQNNNNMLQPRIIGNQEAIQIAISQNAAILFDEKSQYPYFYYYVNNQRFEIWFQDVRSAVAKFNLVKKYNLSGISYWTLMKKSHQTWQALNATFEIKQLK